jgi:predicted O-methyltransferase YrrM
VIIGNIDQTLPDVLKRLKQIDLVYIDANHRYEPTLRYFESLLPLLHEKSLVVIDDIHWSKEMNEAWDVIKDRTEVSLSIDLFEAGLLFFDPNIEKSDYILKF